jgi:hypothetical protein
MPHGIEVDRVQPKSVLDGGSDLFEWEDLE